MINISEKGMKSNLTKLLNEVSKLQDTGFNVNNVNTAINNSSAILNFNDGSIIKLKITANKYETANCNAITTHLDIKFSLNISISGIFNSMRITGVSNGYIDLKCLLVIITLVIDTKLKPTLELIGRAQKGNQAYMNVGVLDINKYIDLTPKSITLAYTSGLIDINDIFIMQHVILI